MLLTHELEMISLSRDKTLRLNFYTRCIQCLKTGVEYRIRSAVGRLNSVESRRRRVIRRIGNIVNGPFDTFYGMLEMHYLAEHFTKAYVCRSFNKPRIAGRRVFFITGIAEGRYVRIECQAI